MSVKKEGKEELHTPEKSSPADLWRQAVSWQPMGLSRDSEIHLLPVQKTQVCVCHPGARPYQSRLLVDLRACGEKSVAGVGFQVDLVTLWGTHTEGAFP